MATSSRRVLRVERLTCPHCDSLVSIKTFKAHKRRFFDDIRGEWLSMKDLDEGGSEHAESPPHLEPEAAGMPLPTTTPDLDTDLPG